MARYRYGSDSSSSSSSNYLCNLCFSLIKLVFTLGVAVFIFWLIYRPEKIKASVDSASLTQFTLTNATTLTYNLTVDVSIRNPNRRIAFYYDYIEAQSLYSGENFATDSNLPSFFQHHKTTAVIRPAFSGKTAALGSSVNGTFNREKSEGFFNVEVKVYSKVRVKILFLKFGHFKPRFDCALKLPVPSNRSSAGGGGGGFEKTSCDVDF